MSRRTAERHQRRIEVRFWRRANPQPHSGYTVDLSRSGLYLGTSVALDPGERLRLELLDREHGFVVEAEVARVHRVSLALRHVEQPGVGVRFLQPAELVGSLIATSKSRTGPLPIAHLRMGSSATPTSRTGSIPAPATARGEPAAPPRPPQPPRADQKEIDDLFGAEAGPGAPRADAVRAPAPAASAPVEPRSVPVEFVDRASFLSVYHRDIAAGGLFVTTDAPAALHERVTIELRPPIRTPHPLRFEARVVHRFEPSASGGNGGTMSGMGVQFLDPDRVRATLAPIVTELRR